MSTEALDRIIKEAKALTPEERHELIDRLAQEEESTMVVKTGFHDSALSGLSDLGEEVTADKAALREWLSKARNMRMELPLTSDSVEIVRELREVRSRQ